MTSRPRPPRTGVPALLALLAASSSAMPFADFYAEVRAHEAGLPPKQAIEYIEKGVAANRLSPSEAARCRIREAVIHHTQGDRPAAQQVIDDILEQSEQLDAQALLDVGNVVKKIYKGAFLPDQIATAYLRMKKISEAPAFAKPSKERGEMLMLLAFAASLRKLGDISHDAGLEAAKCFAGDTGKQADAYFTAASGAQLYRDTAEAERCIRLVLALPGLPAATQKLAWLRLAANAAQNVQHDWRPTSNQLAVAESCLGKATEGRHRFVPAMELLATQVAVMKMADRVGQLDKAILMGREVLADKSAQGFFRGNTAVALAEIYVKAGKYREAIDCYEQSLMKSAMGPKSTHKRIAAIAREAKDFKRAMQAYADALNYCDYEEGKDEINDIRRKAALMSKAVNGTLTTAEADDVFGKENDDLAGLELDAL